MPKSEEITEFKRSLRELSVDFEGEVEIELPYDRARFMAKRLGCKRAKVYELLNKSGFCLTEDPWTHEDRYADGKFLYPVDSCARFPEEIKSVTRERISSVFLAAGWNYDSKVTKTRIHDMFLGYKMKRASAGFVAKWVPVDIGKTKISIDIPDSDEKMEVSFDGKTFKVPFSDGVLNTYLSSRFVDSVARAFPTRTWEDLRGYINETAPFLLIEQHGESGIRILGFPCETETGGFPDELRRLTDDGVISGFLLTEEESGWVLEKVRKGFTPIKPIMIKEVRYVDRQLR